MHYKCFDTLHFHFRYTFLFLLHLPTGLHTILQVIFIDLTVKRQKGKLSTHPPLQAQKAE